MEEDLLEMASLIKGFFFFLKLIYFQRRTEAARIDFIKRKKKKRTKWNEHSLELRGVSIIQGDSFLSVFILHVDPKPTR